MVVVEGADVVMEEAEVRLVVTSELVVDVALVVEVVEVTLRVAVVTAEVALAVEVVEVTLSVAERLEVTVDDEAPAPDILFRILSHLLPG
jgi:hypothetical protein